MSEKLIIQLRNVVISTVFLLYSTSTSAGLPPSTESSTVIGSSLVAESSMFIPYAGLRLIPAIALYQSLYRSNRAHLYDGPNLIGSSKFNELYPGFAASLRIQQGLWWIMPFIGGPTMTDETAINRNIPFWGLGTVNLERTVYGGLILGRDLFRINPFSPLESLAILSSAESASYGSSLLSNGLIMGMGIGFRVVGDELKLNVDQAGSNTDDSINVEPVAEMNLRYLFKNNIEVSTGVKIAYVEGRDVNVGQFFRAETEDDFDVNFYLSVGYNFSF